VCLGTVLVKDLELARYLDYGKKPLLLTVVTLILTWLRQLSNWCRPIDLPTNIIRDCDWTLMMCKRILLQNLFSLLRQLCTVSYSVGCWVNIFSSVNYIMLTSLDEYGLITIFTVWILHGSLSLAWQFVHAVLEHGNFFWRHISLGRVATRFRCSGIFNYHFNADLLLSLTMTEFWKSVKIWQSYHRDLGRLLFWNTVYIQCIHFTV